MKSIVVAVPKSDFRYRHERPERYSPLRANISCFFKRYGMVTFFIAVLFLGMIFGAVKAGSASNEVLEKIDALFSGSITVQSDQTPMNTFVNSFGTSFIFLTLLFCLSLSPLGTIGVPLVMFFRGFVYGISSGFLCITYGLKGLAYYISVMLLGAFVSSLALVYASQYCIDFSVSMLFSIFGKATSEEPTLRTKMSVLVLNCSYMIVLIVFASLIDTGLYYLIGGLFSF